MTFRIWVTGSFLGALFGVIALWISYPGQIAFGALFLKKRLPVWMISIANFGHSDKAEDIVHGGGPKSAKVGRFWGYLISIVVIGVLLFGYHYSVSVDYRPPTVIKIIMIEGSFPLFLILTYVVPIVMLNRFIKNAPKIND